tara:strand:- start:115 stop:363 length:249 start_codon:yes stop_codon:yes gene_type:complete
MTTLIKNLKKSFIFIFIIFSSIGIYKLFGKVNIHRTEINKNEVFRDYAKKLKGCFDLENKNKRRLNESLDLINYCMKAFGID